MTDESNFTVVGNRPTLKLGTTQVILCSLHLSVKYALYTFFHGISVQTSAVEVQY